MSASLKLSVVVWFEISGGNLFQSLIVWLKKENLKVSLLHWSCLYVCWWVVLVLDWLFMSISCDGIAISLLMTLCNIWVWFLVCVLVRIAILDVLSFQIHCWYCDICCKYILQLFFVLVPTYICFIHGVVYLLAIDVVPLSTAVTADCFSFPCDCTVACSARIFWCTWPWIWFRGIWVCK